MKLRDKYGWPVTHFSDRPVVNFIRYLIHTNIRMTWRLRNFTPQNITSECATKAVAVYYENMLAASQAREQQLREALSMHIHLVERNAPQLSGKAHGFAKQSLALPQDTAALQVMIDKAGEAMRERAISEMEDIAPWEHRIEKLNAMPPVTLSDLK